MTEPKRILSTCIADAKIFPYPSDAEQAIQKHLVNIELASGGRWDAKVLKAKWDIEDTSAYVLVQHVNKQNQLNGFAGFLTTD